MSYSESGPDSNFAINSASNFDSSSESNSESQSDFGSMFMNLDICLVFPQYLHSSIYTLLNKLADDFFYQFHNRINSYASNACIMCIFFWHIITQKICYYHTMNFSYFSF